MEWISAYELAKILGMSLKTIQNRLSNGSPMPPSYVVGRSRIFKRSEVDAWIEHRRIETEIENQLQEFKNQNQKGASS